MKKYNVTIVSLILLFTSMSVFANTQQKFDEELNALIKNALITFERGKFEVTKENADMINELAAMLKSEFFTTKTLSIHGFADTTGNSRGFDNQRLSERRARVIYDYLLKTAKVPAARITNVVGWVVATAVDQTLSVETSNRSVRFYVDHQGEAYKFDNLIPKNYQLAMQKNGLTIHKGDNPPMVEGLFEMTPNELVFTSDDKFKVGQRFTDKTISFDYEVVNEHQILIKYESQSGRSIKNSSDVRIIGSGNKFTAYFIAEGIRGGVYSKTANIISGEKTEDGIKDINFAFLILEKENDIHNELMNVGEYRIFQDGKKFSKKIALEQPATNNHIKMQ